jgi:uncharacterized phage protein gp47/JayE
MTVAPVSDIPISIDYTGRDYYAIREQLIARIQDRIPEWTASNPADFGVALVEAFAYIGDLMSYYIDRNANEGFITTATQRDSVLSIAESYGYIPAGHRQATLTVTFQNSSEDTVVTIPAGTVVSGEVVIGDTVETVYFTTDADVTSDPIEENGTVTVLARHGRSVTLVSNDSNEYGELIGTSTGSPDMVFELLETPVVDGSVEIYVQDGDLYSKWTEVQHIIDSNSFEQVFVVSLDANNVTSITFGDGVSGQIPTNFSEIRAKYIVGGGTIGNILSSTITEIVSCPGLTTNEFTALQSIINVLNDEAAIGGSDPESLAQIRYAAPLALRAVTRAVTLEDFRSLALGVSGVGKAQATAEVWTSVTMHISPTRTETDTDLAPGLDDLGDPSLEYDRIKAEVEDYLDGKMLIGTTLTIQPPEYVDVIVAVQYTKLPQYLTSEVERNIKVKIISDYGYNNLDFGDVIYQQDIEYSLQQVAGIKTAKLSVLHIEGDTGVNTLTAATGEIFRFKIENISVSAI